MEYHRPKTHTELKKLRKQQQQKISSDFIEKYISSHPHMVEISYSIQSKQAELDNSYISNPQIRTKTELFDQRKKNSLIENQKTLFQCKTLSERVEEREKMMALKAAESSAKLEKGSNLAFYEESLLKRPVGVHGYELPKFEKNLKDYWKLKNGYIENPYIKPKSENFSRPVSVFTRLKKNSSSVDYEITSKPNNVNPFPGFKVLEIDSAEKKVSSSRFSDSLSFSRPTSQQSSNYGNSNSSKKSRAWLSGEFSNKIVQKFRPNTACLVNRPQNTKNTVRSSGFL